MNKPTPAMRNSLLLIAFAGLTLGIVLKWDSVLSIAANISSVFRPVMIAIVIAFFINLPMRIFERWLMKLLHKSKFKYKETLCRAMGMVLSFFSFVAILVLAISLLYPQLKASITLLVENLPTYKDNLLAWSATYLPELDLSGKISEYYNKMIETLPNLISTIAPHLYSFTTSAASMITDIVIAIVLSFYFLISKDHLVKQAKTLVLTYLPRASQHILPVCTMLNDKFRKFLGGQLTEAVILGMLCFIGMTILGIPYAPLVSTLIGVTAVVPIFGAIIGTIPSVFILLMANPLQALIFLIFLIVVQQIEGNVIYPRVVGNSIGLSGLWVLLAVVIGGGFWGIPGIFIGIPVMSALYELVKNDIDRRKKQKEKETTEIRHSSPSA